MIAPLAFRVAPVVLSLALVAAGPPLEGTRPWDLPADPAKQMVEGLHVYLDREIKAAVPRRDAWYDRSHKSPEAYASSVEANRNRFAGYIGTTNDRARPRLVYESLSGTEPLSRDAKVRVTAVRWAVYPGFEAEGIEVAPTGEIKANVVVLPDADGSPEQLAGIAPGLPPESQVARRLAESGCRVLVPTLLDRSSEFSGSPLVRFTNLTHREWIYRMAYECGRHVIGYEVDEVRAAVDWFRREGEPKRPVGVVGYGEGGLVALYAAAVDTRIDAAWVAGYFGPREGLWSEPVYRNVWSMLGEFGDAEIGSLVSPRGLTIEACKGPEVAGPPPAVNGRSDAASGRIASPAVKDVTAEFERLNGIEYSGPGGLDPHLIKPEAGAHFNAGDLGLRGFLNDLKLPAATPSDTPLPADPRPKGHDRARMARLVKGMSDYTQNLVRTSELRRETYWSRADRSNAAAWDRSLEYYRADFWRDLIGKLAPPESDAEALTTRIYDEPKWTGYAVKIPVLPNVAASGVLLIPKDLKKGERRPVVVCQHGLEGTPKPVVEPGMKTPYNGFGAQLADRGYIVYAPQNPYIGNDRFRQLQRKANPQGLSLFSIIIAQHAHTLDWLKSRPEVDPARIALYGISYGGKTAMRVPAVLKDYCLSICSADFNEWAVKCTNIDRKYSYLYTIEYDMYEFGLTERFNYSEMAGLIAPRPFMVERGHDDTVAPDEWVAYEYAKVRRLYDKLGIGDRTEMTVFNGGHQIEGKDTFAFLAKHLKWPRGAQAP